MRLYGIKTDVIMPGDDIVGKALRWIDKRKLQLGDKDVLVVTSKILSYAENRIVNLSTIEPSPEAMKLAKEYSLQPQLAEMVLQEADHVYGGVCRAILTLKKGMLVPNAGVDNKNADHDKLVLWPKDPMKWAKSLRDNIRKKTGKRVGVLIIDSGLIPLRIGTIGIALAVAGFRPIRDLRGNKDLYGKPLIITRQAVADDLACAAHAIIGEAAEQTPMVLIKDAPIDFDNNVYSSVDMMMPPKDCIFMGTFLCNPSPECTRQISSSQNL